MSHKKIPRKSNADDVFPGPKAFLASGYNCEQLSTLRVFLNSLGYDNAPIHSCTLEQMNDTIETVLLNDTNIETPAAQELPFVMLLSGLTRTDLQTVMKYFSTTALPRPIFAMATPTNLTFTLKTLLAHLQEEQKSFLKKK